MTVYLLHFDSPISDHHTCQHYIGFANNIEARIAHHHNGTSGARLLEVAKQRGISFTVVRVWEKGDKKFERKLKNRHDAPRLCPICKKLRKEKDVQNHLSS